MSVGREEVRSEREALSSQVGWRREKVGSGGSGGDGCVLRRGAAMFT